MTDKQEWEIEFDKKFSNDIFYGVATFFQDEQHNLDRVEGEKVLNGVKDFIRQTLSLQKQQIVEDERQRIKQWVKEQEPNYMSLDKTETDSFYIDSGELLKAISPLEVK